MKQNFHEGDYVLGTKLDELERLGLQNAVWRPRATDAWRRAGFTAGQHLIDVGCGPGYATFDLSDIVGTKGRITAIDRSARFLEHLSKRLSRETARTIDVIEADLDTANFPSLQADGAWCRWVFAFVTRPRELLSDIRKSLRPGASIVIHEYFDYGTWSVIPGGAELVEFVDAVKSSWRANGGEPDIARQLLTWLPMEGFRIAEARPLIDVVSPRDFIWQWPASFVEVGLGRLVELGHITAERAAAIIVSLRETAADPNARMITPGVLEIIAVATE
ncbi:MAG TPA: methyltransferase domain-containing protein [Gemmatimonadaceae bacterium]|nr:methyltransferase domain-containing protein [Gemmatimonadaceae bacterium]